MTCIVSAVSQPDVPKSFYIAHDIASVSYHVTSYVAHP